MQTDAIAKRAELLRISGFSLLGIRGFFFLGNRSSSALVITLFNTFWIINKKCLVGVAEIGLSQISSGKINAIYDAMCLNVISTI